MKATTLALVLLSMTAAGCKPETKVFNVPLDAKGLPASVMTTTVPAGALEVADVKANAKEGDVVVVRGVVGGSAKPVVAGRAVFTLGDVKGLAMCTGEGESCSTPWDACCMAPDAKAANTLTVQVLDADGRPLAVDVGGSGIKPMSTVVVTGKVGPRPDPRVLVVDATSVYVAKP